MGITIKDVAKRAGVSISTVSRVINNSKPVSDEIRQRVLDIIKETDYVPNPLARSLVTKKSNVIGVIVPNISDFFMSELLNGIEEIGKIYNYDILLCNSYGEVEEELNYINLLKSKQVAGIIFVSWKVKQSHIDVINAADIPVVFMSKSAKEFDVHYVSIDNFNASYDMTKYLIDNGHKKIAFIKSTLENSSSDVERFNGYKKALLENDLNIDESLLKEGDFNSESGYRLMDEILQSKNIPHAVFTTGDEIAIGVISCLLDNGYRVPEDVSVSGFNDVKIASLYRPSLTTIKQPIYDMGAVCTRMIVKLIEKEEIESKHVYLSYELVERQSVCKRK